jgi:nicotinamide-nucleotide amidase
MRGEMILIGDELISGKLSDSNARYAAASLWPLDLRFAAMQMVGDNPEAIAGAFMLARRADFVIVSGGLGTTEDDITNRCAADFFSLPLEEHALMLENFQKHARLNRRRFTPAHRRMALVPRGVESLDELCAGWFYRDQDQRFWFFLPGVPHEFTRILDNKVLPCLRSRYVGLKVDSRYLTVFGLSESEIGRRLQGITAGIDGAALGYYPVFPEEKLIISARAHDEEALRVILDKLENEICSRLGNHVLHRGPDPIEQVVGRILRARGLTLTVAESCTGGLICHRLTSVAGASGFLRQAFITYSNQSKIDTLGVDSAIIAQYGAVSAACALAMARGARARSGADVALAVTGIAGPEGGSDEKPVGTVFLALSAPEGEFALPRGYYGPRNWVQALSAEGALDMLRRYLAGMLDFG